MELNRIRKDLEGYLIPALTITGDSLMLDIPLFCYSTLLPECMHRDGGFYNTLIIVKGRYYIVNSSDLDD
jgi:hypothetical protein